MLSNGLVVFFRIWIFKRLKRFSLQCLTFELSGNIVEIPLPQVEKLGSFIIPGCCTRFAVHRDTVTGSADYTCSSPSASPSRASQKFPQTHSNRNSQRTNCGGRFSEKICYRNEFIGRVGFYFKFWRLIKSKKNSQKFLNWIKFSLALRQSKPKENNYCSKHTIMSHSLAVLMKWDLSIKIRYAANWQILEWVLLLKSTTYQVLQNSLRLIILFFYPPVELVPEVINYF